MSFVLDDLDSPSATQGGIVAGSAPASSTLGRSTILSSSAGSNALADFATATSTATATAEPEPTETPEPEPTETPVPAVQALVEEPEPEPEPPTATPIPPTETPEPPTATPVPPTATPSPIPTATPTPTRTPRPSQTATPGEFSVTRYADSLENSPLGCSYYGTYDPDNPLIVAVGAARHVEWPCGTQLQICGPAGCIIALRADSCPGCGPNHIDMSRAGVLAVCGNAGGCNVVVRKQ